MRLWSLHPCYLDAQGLVAVWREGLLAIAVLLGQTMGYTHHPQLNRFIQHPQPVNAANYYLEQILREAEKRGYHFAGEKIMLGLSPQKIPVSTGQMEYEFTHLKRKIAARSPKRLPQLADVAAPEANPLFIVIPGEIEPWEKVSQL
jgi:hypothetical protein